DAQAVRATLGVARFDVEHGEPSAARAGALRTRQRERHLGRDRRRKPLSAVQTPYAVLAHGSRQRGADVRTADQLRHPLTAGPGALWITTRQPRQRTGDQRLVTR